MTRTKKQQRVSDTCLSRIHKGPQTEELVWFMANWDPEPIKDLMWPMVWGIIETTKCWSTKTQPLWYSNARQMIFGHTHDAVSIFNCCLINTSGYISRTFSVSDLHKYSLTIPKLHRNLPEMRAERQTEGKTCFLLLLQKICGFFSLTFSAWLVPHVWECSSVGTASNWHAANAGSIPWSGKGFFSQSQLSVQTLLWCLYTPVCNHMQ